MPAQLAIVNWGALSQILAPAISVDKERDIEDVRQCILLGEMKVFKVNGFGAIGLVVTGSGSLDGKKYGCIVYIAGSVKGVYRSWLKTMRRLIVEFESMAKADGCEEMYIVGRDWSKVLPGYSRREGHEKRNELIKAL